ncbi:MAG: hypothetical protein N2Z22_05950 [Turneriella sp.]|nr:hypothetical protein [Leptospiraceae bacterium]MCX7632856.1 hypothetical protein [Turneriella sp.]
MSSRRLGLAFLLCVNLSAATQEEVHAPDPLGLVFATQPETAKKFRRFEREFTLDAYYSSFGLITNFTNEPIANLGEESELRVYQHLLSKPFLPRFAVLETSVYPIPVAGVLLRERANEFYQRGQIGGEMFNIFRAATRGFQEPYALSLFLGNVVRYQPLARTEEERRQNRASGLKSSIGYSGYLISAGTHHIKDNELFPDNWLELELKFKGDQIFTLQKLQWNYKIGVKLHDNPHISDVLVIAIQRNRLDYTADAWSFLANSGFEYRMDFRLGNFSPARIYFEVNKKWPMKNFAALILAVGFTWESESLYSGPLDNYPGGEHFQILLRPNLEF